MMYMLNENVTIHPNTDITDTSITDVFQCTLDNYMSRIANSLTDFYMRNGYARPLRVRTATGCLLLTDTTYSIDEYDITYIKRPNRISLDRPFDLYSDFTDEVLKEIVKLSVAMYIENQKN